MDMKRKNDAARKPSGGGGLVTLLGDQVALGDRMVTQRHSVTMPPCKDTLNTYGAKPGMTILECLLAMAILAIVLASAVAIAHSASVVFDATQSRTALTEEAAASLAHVATALRQARAVSAVQDNGAGTASLTFLASDGTRTTFGRDAASGQLYFGPVGSTAVLARNATALALRGFTADGTAVALPAAEPTGVATVEMTVTIMDPRRPTDSASLTSRASLERTPPTVIINEIMYKPSSSLGGADKNQWVELYNAASTPVDVAGWYFWTKGQNTPDALQPDALYSTGSTVLAPGQFAVVTDTDSELYREVLSNGDFESSDLHAWWCDRPTWYWSSGGAYSGSYKVFTSGGPTMTTLYQDFKIPSDRQHPRLLVRARMASGSAPSSRLIVRITNRGAVVYVLAYDGPLSANWVTYAADLTSVVNKDARLEVKVSSASIWDTIYVDAAAVFSSRLPTLPLDCLHLWVNDSTLGKNLEDKQVFLSQGSALRDAVVFDTTWGGNGDGSTLSRTSPWAPSTEQSSWRPGPYAGTPAMPNN